MPLPLHRGQSSARPPTTQASHARSFLTERRFAGRATKAEPTATEVETTATAAMAARKRKKKRMAAEDEEDDEAGGADAVPHFTAIADEEEEQRAQAKRQEEEKEQEESRRANQPTKRRSSRAHRRSVDVAAASSPLASAAASASIDPVRPASPLPSRSPRPVVSSVNKHALALAMAAAAAPLNPSARTRENVMAATSGVRDARLRAILQRNQEDERKAAAMAAHKTAVAAPAAANASDAAAAAAALALQTAREIEQQVLDEWTSSDDDDAPVPLEFQQSMHLSRTTRAGYGLKSMRDICNLLARPMNREDALDEYEQQGAFQGSSYWPPQGQYVNMQLRDAAVPGAVARIKSAAHARPSSGVGHARRHTATLKRSGTIDSGPTAAAAAAAGSLSSRPATANTASTSALADMDDADADGDVHSFNLLDSGLDSSASRAATARAQTALQAASLLAAAQNAPFVKLRRDMESADDNNPFARLMQASAGGKPLLSDAQIDALLAAKIDASVRKGFPRNRAELMRSKGTILFGMTAAHTQGDSVASFSQATALGRQPTAISAPNSCGPDGIAGMFYSAGTSTMTSARGNIAHARRNMTINTRPYSARTPAQIKEIKQVREVWNRTRSCVNENPPVGTYDPSRGLAFTTDRNESGPAFAAQSARDHPLDVGGLGDAQTLGATRTAQLQRLTGSYETGPGPADVHIARDFESYPSALALRDQAGHTFSRGDVGSRVAVPTARGAHVTAATNATMGVRGDRGVHAAPSIEIGTAVTDEAQFAPLHFSKLYSSLTPAATHGVSFGSAVNARVVDAKAALAVREQQAVFTAASSLRAQPPALQYSDPNLMGLHARGGVRASAPAPPAISFTRHAPPDRPGADVGVREVMRLKEKRAAATLAQRRTEEADLAVRRAKAAAKRHQRDLRIQEQQRERDMWLAEKRQRESELSSMRPTLPTADAATIAPAPSPPLPPLSASSSDSDITTDFTPTERRDRALRATLLPATAWTAAGRAARLAAQAATHRARTQRVAAAREETHQARQQARTAVAIQHGNKQAKDRDQVAMALKLKDVQVRRKNHIHASERLTQQRRELNLSLVLCIACLCALCVFACR